MDRRAFIRKTGAFLGGSAAGALAAPAVAQSLPTIRWQLASDYPKALDIIYGGAERLARLVAEATDGKFQIETHPTGEVVPTFGLLKALDAKIVEMGQTAMYNYFAVDPTFAFGTAVPFGLNARMQNAWMYYGGGLDLFNAFCARHGFRTFVGGNTGAQMGGWFREEIVSVEQFRGMSMRIGGFAARVFTKLGAVPEGLPVARILDAFRDGSVDAAELVGPYDDEKFGLNTVARYYYYPGWWEGGAMLSFLVGLDAWNALPPAYQSILSMAAAAVNVDVLAHYDAANPAALRRLVDGGTLLRSFPTEVTDACLRAANEVYAEISAENADFKTIADSMIAFRDDAYRWFPLADGAYDAFMAAADRNGDLGRAP
jgi:TRAP-type mannitol/chloroaromatic compound transport system substrate-binding protein